MVVVETDDIDGTTLEEMVLWVGFVATSRNRTDSPRVILLHQLGKMLRQERVYAQFIAMRQGRSIVPGIQYQIRLLQRKRIGSGIRPLFQHLVADAPHDDARMVSIPFYQIREIALMPFIEEAGIVAIRFLATPHIETLVHHEEAHRIAHVQEFRSRRIMTASDGIHTHIAKDGELAMHRILVYGCTQTAEVVVLADTIDLEVPAIEEETLLRIKLHISETCGGSSGIHHLTIHHQFALHAIEITFCDIPELRILYLKLLHLVALALCHHLAFRIVDGVADGKFHLAALGKEIHLHLHITLRRGRYILSPLRDVCLLHGLGEPYMAIDAAARIPAAIGLVAVIHLYGDDIITLPINIRCKVVLKSAVTIRSGAQFVPIDINGRVHIHAIEGDGKAVVLLLRIHGKMLAIPADASRQSATAGSRRIGWSEIALYRPIVREIQAAPMSVSIFRFLHTGTIG